MKNLILIISFISTAFAVNAQQNKTAPADKPEYVIAKLGLKAKGYNNKIVLRWAVNNPAAWPLLQRAGVWVERAVLDEQNKLTTNTWTRVNKTPVKPWTAEQFKKPGLLQNADNNLLIAAEALYGTPATMVSAKVNSNNIMLAGQEYQNRFTMALMSADLSPQAADALGLRYQDSINVNPKYKYTYRVYAAVSHPVIKIDTAYYFYTGNLKDEKKAPEMVLTRGLDRKIEVYWPKSSPQNNFTSYNVERSADGKKFTRLNKTPLMFSGSDTTTKEYVFGDSVENYKTWHYRVNGIDAFGDTSYYCPSVSAQAKNKTAPPAAYLNAKADKKGNVTLNWTKDEHPGRPISGYLLRRGRSIDVLDETVHPQILPKTTLTYTDKPGKLDDGVYYQLIAIDTAGNYSFSNVPFVFTNDTIAPKAPLGLAGTVDTLGNVKLSWNHDYQDNIIAYRLFVSNNPNATFSPVTPGYISDTAYVDKLSNTILNRKIYYKVVAIDGNNNHSIMSPNLELKKPKVVISPAPVIGKFKVSQKSVQFEFSLLAEDDMAQINVLRKPAGTTIWTPITKLPIAARIYTDSTVNSGTRYEYALQSVDNDQKKSAMSNPLSVLVYNAPAEAPVGLQLKTDKNTVTLNWSAPKQPAKFFIIYKDNGQGLAQYTSVDGNVLTFKESSAGKVRYGIKAVYQGQQTSDVTESAWATLMP